MRKTPKTIKYRRQREGRTSYKKRLAQLKSGLPRMAVRTSHNHVLIQIIVWEPDGDKVLMSAHSKELVKQGYKGHTGNTSSAYLVGRMLANKAKKVKEKVNELILDSRRPSLTSQSIVYAAAKGALDGGLKFNIDESVFPSEDRINGKHVAAFAEQLKGKPEYDKQFSGYKKRGLAPEKLPEHVQEILAKVSN